jgi:hypothetical protein
MHVDEAGRDRQPAAVERLAGLAVRCVTDMSNPALGQCDVRNERWAPLAIVDADVRNNRGKQRLA